MTTRIPHWISGALVPGTSGRTSPVFNPATGVHTGDVDLASAAEVDQAVASAREAARAWRGAPLSKRSSVVFEFRRLLREHSDELAATITAEHGKVHADALG